MARINYIDTTRSITNVCGLDTCGHIVMLLPGVTHPTFSLEYYKFLQTTLSDDYCLVIVKNCLPKNILLLGLYRLFNLFELLRTNEPFGQSARTALYTLKHLLRKKDTTQTLTIVAHAEGSVTLANILSCLNKREASRISVVTLSSLVRKYSVTLKSELHIFTKYAAIMRISNESCSPLMPKYFLFRT